MRTTKPISTISYNSYEDNEFLQHKLNELIERNIIDFWCYITHSPEHDEKKIHSHLYIVPSQQIDTKRLEREFDELVPNMVKPLGVMPFQSSKFADWYLYGLHDTAYLATKGQMRHYHYTDKDIKYSNETYFLELKHTIDYNKSFQYQKISEMIQEGCTDADIVRMFPIQQINYVLKACVVTREQLLKEKYAYKSYDEINEEKQQTEIAQKKND